MELAQEVWNTQELAAGVWRAACRGQCRSVMEQMDAEITFVKVRKANFAERGG